MAIARRIMAAGCSAVEANAISGDTKTGIAAAGSTQATATILGAANNDIATCPSSAGVQLPLDALAPGDEIMVYNGGANTLAVYGLTGDAINNGSVNAAYSVAANLTAYFTRVDGTHWRAVKSS